MNPMKILGLLEVVTSDKSSAQALHVFIVTAHGFKQLAQVLTVL